MEKINLKIFGYILKDNFNIELFNPLIYIFWSRDIMGKVRDMFFYSDWYFKW